MRPRKPSYRIGKPWKSSTKDIRDYITYLRWLRRNKDTPIPPDEELYVENGYVDDDYVEVM